LLLPSHCRQAPRAANNFPEWLEVNFGANKTINEIHVFTLQTTGATRPSNSLLGRSGGAEDVIHSIDDGGLASGGPRRSLRLAPRPTRPPNR